MNYCPRCGAYIPQGYTECLACGYSAKESKHPDVHNGFASHPGAASATAQAQAPDSSEYHQAHKKKEEAKQKTEQYEYGQAKKEEQKTEQQQTSRIDERIDIENYRGVSYLSYLGPLFLVPMFMAGNSSFAQFHAKQGLKLFILEVIVNACWSMGVLGVLVALVGTVLAAWCTLNGLVNVSQGAKRVLPVIGNLGKGSSSPGGGRT